MNAKYTPGPWEIYDFDQTENNLIQIRSKTADRLVAAAIHDDPVNPGAEDLANAALIARAPRMDIALRSICVNLRLAECKGVALTGFLKLASDAAQAATENRGKADPLRGLSQHCKPTRIIIEVRGGLVCAVYSNDETVNVDVLDWDAQEDCEDEDPHRMEGQRVEALQKEIEDLIDIY